MFTQAITNFYATTYLKRTLHQMPSNMGNTVVCCLELWFCALVLTSRSAVRWRTIAFRSILWHIPNDSLRLFLGASPRRTFVDESRNGAPGIQIRVPSSSHPPFAHCRESVRYQAVEIRDRALPKVVQVVQKVERVFISPSLCRDSSRIGGTR